MVQPQQAEPVPKGQDHHRGLIAHGWVECLYPQCSEEHATRQSVICRGCWGQMTELQPQRQEGDLCGGGALCAHDLMLLGCNSGDIDESSQF